jgi:putative membrane protein
VRGIIIRFIINAVSLWVASVLVEGITVAGSAVEWLVLLAIFALINAVIKPVLKLLTLPINVMTLGLFTWVINAFLLWLTSVLTDALTVDGIIAAFLGSLVISIVSTLLSWFVPD